MDACSWKPCCFEPFLNRGKDTGKGRKADGWVALPIPWGIPCKASDTLPGIEADPVVGRIALSNKLDSGSGIPRIIPGIFKTGCNATGGFDWNTDPYP